MIFSKSQKLLKPTWIFCDGGSGEVITLGQPPTTQQDGITRGGGGQKSRPAPPPSHITLQAGCGAVARNAVGEILQWTWRTLPPMTNNEAEYAGLMLGIELADHLRLRSVGFVLDSSVVVMQMQGRAAVNSPGLRAWHQRACHQVRRFESVEFHLIPRELNYLADSLTWQARQPWEVTQQWLNKSP